MQRSEIAPKIYDYHDYKIEYLHKMFLRRNVFYRQLTKSIALLDDEFEVEGRQNNLLTISKDIRFPIEQLSFLYGAFSFTILIKDIKQEISFEIENDTIRPEFEVLKPYLVKYFKSSNIKIHVFAEVQYGKVVSQLASSMDLDKINEEIIETVRFKFVEQKIYTGKFPANTGKNIHDISQAGDLYVIDTT